jgi:dTDP-4-amino-4,6-dideoxy-D-galactose acyltransferase
MQIVHDAWLSTTLARQAFSVHPVPGVDPGEAARTVQSHAAGQAATFYFAKVPILDVTTVEAFTSVGFCVIETSLMFAFPMTSLQPDPASCEGLDVSDFEPRWHTGVLDVAGSCFRYSRFHVDPAFGKPLADHVKREWIRSYVEGKRGDRLLVAHSGDNVLGFAAMMLAGREARTAAVIDLIGVSAEQQRRGVGRRLVQAAAAVYASRCATLEVGTQASNVPSVRLYERLGFRLVRSGYVLHLHTSVV